MLLKIDNVKMSKNRQCKMSKNRQCKKKCLKIDDVKIVV